MLRYFGYTRKRDEKLTPKQSLAINFYCDPKSPTFGNETKSYLAAKYKNGIGAPQAACKMFNLDKVKQAIEMYQPKALAKKVEISREYAYSKLQDMYERCWTDHDNTNSVGVLRLICQATGIINDKLVIDLKDSRQLEDGHREAARRIGAYLLSDGILDAEFEPLKLFGDNKGSQSENDVSDNVSTDNIVDSSE